MAQHIKVVPYDSAWPSLFAVEKKAIEKTASTFAGKTVTGKIASSVLSRGMSANVITSAASFGISEVGEIVNLCRGKISGKQFAKKMGML